MGLDDVAFANIADAEHEAGLAVSLTDNGVAREEQGLRAFLRARQFSEDNADHEGLQDYAGH